MFVFLICFLSVPQTWSFPLSYFQLCLFLVLPIHIRLNSSTEFFHFSYCTFQIQNFYLVSFYVFYLFTNISFVHTVFSWFSSTSSFSSLRIFKTIVLNSLCNISTIRSFSGAVFTEFFSLWMGHTFLFHCRLSDISCWKLEIRLSFPQCLLFCSFFGVFSGFFVCFFNACRLSLCNHQPEV